MLLLHFVALDVDTPSSVGPDGFVHLCWSHQAADVLRRHFEGGPATALVVDRDALAPERLREEDSYGHGAYPHYYGELARDWVVASHRLEWVDGALLVDGAAASGHWVASL